MVLKLGAIVALMAAVAALAAWLLLGVLRAPMPHDVPIAIVGKGAAVTQVAKVLDAEARFAVTRVADGATARRLIAERKVYGAFALKAKVGRVLTASAASVPVAGLLTAAFTRIDVHHKLPTVVTDAKPLPAQDAAGAASYLLTLIVIAVAVFAAWGLEVVAPGIRRGPLAALARIGALAFVSLATGAILAAVATQFGVYHGYFWEAGGTFALATFAIALVTAFLTSAGGAIFGLLASLAIFVLAGVLATPGGSSPQFLTDVWRQIASGLPARSTIDLVRNIVYFDHEAITTPLLVLGGYVVGGIVLIMGLSPLRRKAA